MEGQDFGPKAERIMKMLNSPKRLRMTSKDQAAYYTKLDEEYAVRKKKEFEDMKKNPKTYRPGL